jgi:hypothetical protein
VYSIGSRVKEEKGWGCSAKSTTIYNARQRLIKIVLMIETVGHADIANSTYNMIDVFTPFCMDDQMIGSLKGKQDAHNSQ